MKSIAVEMAEKWISASFCRRTCEYNHLMFFMYTAFHACSRWNLLNRSKTQQLQPKKYPRFSSSSHSFILTLFVCHNRCGKQISLALLISNIVRSQQEKNNSQKLYFSTFDKNGEILYFRGTFGMGQRMTEHDRYVKSRTKYGCVS